MEHYFVVLHLPGGKRLKLEEGNKSSKTMLYKALQAIGNGKAKLVSRRQDTGAAEEIRAHAERANRFKTYLLVNMHLDTADCTQNILKKAVRHLSVPKEPTLIDAGDNYQLIAVDC